MAYETRVASLVLMSFFLFSRPTHADSTPAETLVSQARATGIRADVRTQVSVDASHLRHILTMTTVRVPLTARVTVRAGAGSARVLCEPSQTGSAVAAGARVSMIEGAGLSLGVEMSALTIRYADGGLDDARVMLSLASLNR